MAKPNRVSAPDGEQVGLNWPEIRELPLVFADQVHIQRVPDRFYVTFGQVNLPIISGAPPSGFRADVRPVIRLVITAEDMRRIVGAIQTVMEPVEKVVK
jgi:hypothetical protein